MLAHLFRATPQRSRQAGNSIENQSDRSDGRQLENHTHRDHQRYETRNASATNSIRQLWREQAVGSVWIGLCLLDKADTSEETGSPDREQGHQPDRDHAERVSVDNVSARVERRQHNEH